jgi:tetratricopeptide (TPR) repeat protein
VALNNLAFALAVHLGKPAEAQPIAKRAAALAPRVGTVLDTLAWTEHLLGNEEAASKLLGDAIRLDPKEPEIRLHAAIVYAATGLLEQSRVELQEALRLDAQLASSDEVKQLQSRLAAAKNH